MESKHTPGPWEQEGPYIHGPDPARLTVCYMFYIGRGYQEESAANESLIKSAPDLLDALKSVLSMIESGILVRDTSKDLEPGWAMRQIPIVTSLQKAGNAIAKAEGR